MRWYSTVYTINTVQSGVYANRQETRTIKIKSDWLESFKQTVNV